MAEDLKKMYRTIVEDHFPTDMEISFVDGDRRQTLFYEKVLWTIDQVRKGLRYGENPGQEAALYRLVNGNLILGETQTIQPGHYLVSDIELLQSGKHPGKTNLTDADNALNILRYFTRPAHGHHRQAQQSLRRGPGRHPGKGLSSRPHAPTGWRPSAAVSPSTGRWTMPPPKPSSSNMPKWWWRRISRTGVMDIFARKNNLRVIRHRQYGTPPGLCGQTLCGVQKPHRRRHHRPVVLCAQAAPRTTCNWPNASTRDSDYKINRSPTPR